MRTRIGISLAALAAAICAFSGSAGAEAACSLVAAPAGSDSAAGSVTAPFRTAQKLVDSLHPGQTGCLRAGVYREDVRVSNGGRPGSPVTLASYQGESATIVGRFFVPQGSDFVTVTGLRLDGRNAANLPSPTINANDVVFAYDDVTNDHTGICFVVGSSYGRATNTLITHDRIHDCGALPPTNHDHGIYVEAATNTRIEWNLIYSNADRGIQLYPDGQYTTVDHNVIDGNGEGFDFSGDAGVASNNAAVYDNLITNSKLRYDISSWYPPGTPAGTGNLLSANCVWGGHLGTVDSSQGGFRLTNNLIANPQYIGAANHDYRLQPSSPCLAITGDIAAAVDGAHITGLSPGFAVQLAGKHRHHRHRHHHRLHRHHHHHRHHGHHRHHHRHHRHHRQRRHGGPERTAR